MNFTFLKSIRIAAIFIVPILAVHVILAQTTQPKVEGTYDAEVTTEGYGTTKLTFVIKREGEKLTAEGKESEGVKITGIKVEGEQVTLAAAYQDNPFELPGKLTAEGMGGKWEAVGLTGSWRAKRQVEK